MVRSLSDRQPTFDFRLEELARNVGALRREVRSLNIAFSWGDIEGTLSNQTDLQAAPKDALLMAALGFFTALIASLAFAVIVAAKINHAFNGEELK